MTQRRRRRVIFCSHQELASRGEGIAASCLPMMSPHDDQAMGVARLILASNLSVHGASVAAATSTATAAGSKPPRNPHAMQGQCPKGGSAGTLMQAHCKTVLRWKSPLRSIPTTVTASVAKN